jgi:hypothetical protein
MKINRPVQNFNSIPNNSTHDATDNKKFLGIWHLALLLIHIKHHITFTSHLACTKPVGRRIYTLNNKYKTQRNEKEKRVCEKPKTTLVNKMLEKNTFFLHKNYIKTKAN